MSRILVVDDDELVRMNLEAVLKMEGYDVRTADAGEIALLVAGEARPDLVVLDINMPRMSGWETLGKLREIPGNEDVPVVALTGDVEDARAFRAAGFNAYLSKGGSLDQFLCTVRSALNIAGRTPGTWLHSCNGQRCIVSPSVDTLAS